MTTSDAGALSPIKRALVEIRELKAKLARAEGAIHEPIAIVGIGLRFPGADDITSFADSIWSGRDAVGPIPRERWPLDDFYADDPDAPGKLTTRYGAFLDDVDSFDAEFFGIAPREAASMDPQQRLLLEVMWHALEDAGHAPTSLAGSRTGVYLGISNGDYGRALFGQRELIDPYFSTGNAYSVAAGRLSYFLGLQGPSIAIDTACSSSLVALHLACQGLRLRDCDAALAGGVNLVLTPEMNISFSKARMMAPDGRCKTFDAAADGYVRGEGCAVLVLRRLSDALESGDRILAVVRGTAINQDGRSNGITAPNGPAQEDVIRRALEAAKVSPREIGYVEAHGTGTPLGDPIEVRALGAVLCEGRDPSHPLVIGSVKTNIGHLEAAAGFAGVVKVVLGLQRKVIPPHLHFKAGNPMIDWSALPIRVPTTLTPWAPIEGRRLAGVSSFGFSGTNAHAILEEAPVEERRAEGGRPIHLLTLSGRDDEALVKLAASFEAAIADEPIADVCFTANAGRSHLSHRLAVVGKTADEIRAGLGSFARGESNAAVAIGTVHSKPKVAFLYTGQGAQSVGMGRALYETSPTFREALDACASALAPHLDKPLLDVVFGAAESIDQSTYAQPATFAIEYALSQLWRSWGVEPAFVLGHSLGEYAAACVAGVLSLEDAARIVAHRGKLADGLPPGGAMATIFAREDVVLGELAKTAGAVTIAAYNGPEHFVVSGPRAHVEAILSRLEGAGVRVKMLRISWASHSPLIEPILPAFRQTLSTARFEAPRIALVSNVTGKLVSAGEIGPDYWLTHMRQPVRFAQSIELLADQGVTHFVEVGPHPVLLGVGAECLANGGAREWLPSLRRDREAYADLLESLQRLYVSGAEIDWNAFDRGHPRQRLALPTYPFRKVRHWVDAIATATEKAIRTGERWERVSAALERQSERGPVDLNVASYPAKWNVLARLTSAHAEHVLREAGLFVTAGERRSLDEVLATAGISKTYRHLVERWLDRLARGGRLRKEGSSYVSDAPLNAPDLSALWKEAERLFVDNRPLLAYVEHCGELVGPVIRGQESPLETLFPSGSFELADGLYRRSTTMEYINGVASAAIEALGASTPSGRVLRVLEVGAGTGGTTASLLPLLPKDRTRYSFTDVSDVFLDRARATFAAYPFVDYGLFDVDKDLAAQGYAPGSFDVIVSANAVHACSDLRAALKRLRDLLAPGGVLVLVESTVHMDWFDMTTGLIEGWQAFVDDLRTDNPLLPPSTWVEALTVAGFDAASAWPRAGSPAEVLGQHVLVARAPGDSDFAVAEARFSEAAPRADQAAPERTERALSERVLELLPSERIDFLRDVVRERVMKVLRLDAARPPARDVRLLDLGFDSLMAVQLRDLLTKELALPKRLPATLLFDHPTIDALAKRLLELITPKAETEAMSQVTAVAATPEVLGAAAVEAMSEEEVEALLLKRLEGS
jgi:acyl transferase domain-containing protein/SAM-dependent methyltransferase